MKNVYLCSMKRATIWALGVGMSLSFLVLLFLQINYMTRFVTLRKAQFDENVNRSLSEAVSNVELNESRLYLENLVRENLRDSMYASEEVDTNVQKVRSHYTTFEQTTFDNRRDNRPKAVIGDVSRSQMGDVIKKMYMNRRATLDKAVYSMIEAGRGLQLKKRINFRMLDQEVKNELRDNGLMMPYHIKVLDAKGNVLYRCSDYSEEKNEVFYRAKMFKWMDDKDNAFVEVHFPDYSSYITGSMRLMVPSVCFTIILLATFVFTIYLIFRQKKLSEIKSDFISNMTHEFKTPISTISLAAQMLKDESLAKSPAMLKKISGVINDETKRLRFQVDKVLQMSLFEKQETTLKKVELNCNELIEGVTKTFRLKIEQVGGSIEMKLNAQSAMVYVDEMHFTNVIFNLMDNAVKYRREEIPLRLVITTANVGKDRIGISVQDNGIGIKKDDVKRVFEKFYRVHTGNVHNVKGFGLGLAYVNKIVEEHKGTIKCDSELGKGTRFFITIPIIKNN